MLTTLAVQIANLDKPIELSPLQLMLAILGIIWVVLKSGPVLQSSFNSWKEIFQKAHQPEADQNAKIADHERRISANEDQIEKCMKYLDKDKVRLEGVDEWILEANRRFQKVETELSEVQKTTTHINDAIEVLIDGQIATMQALGRQVPDDTNLEKKTGQLMNFLLHGTKDTGGNT